MEKTSVLAITKNGVNIGENLKKLFDNETLARFAISNPENLQNYDDYAAMVSNFERTHPNSGIYADT